MQSSSTLKIPILIRYKNNVIRHWYLDKLILQYVARMNAEQIYPDWLLKYSLDLRMQELHAFSE